MACPVRQLQEQSKRIREGGGLSHSAAAQSGEVLGPDSNREGAKHNDTLQAAVGDASLKNC